MEKIKVEPDDEHVCTPELVICDNFDDFELAQDPFAEDQAGVYNRQQFPVKVEQCSYIVPEGESNTPPASGRMKTEPPDEPMDVPANKETSAREVRTGDRMNIEAQTKKEALSSDEEDDSRADGFDMDNGFADTRTSSDESLDEPIIKPPAVLDARVKEADAITGSKAQVKAAENAKIAGDHAKSDSKEEKAAKREAGKRGRPRCTERHQCAQCGKTYAYASLLRRHSRTHQADKGFNCSACSKSFARPDQCRTHMDMVHKGEMVGNKIWEPSVELKCEQCGKVFHHVGNYRKHLKIHSGERPFACNLCEKTFLLAQHLKSHIQLVHVNEKAFQCALCGKLFNHVSNYKKHMRIHNGDKPHKCELCDKAFGSTSNYQAHMRVHANDRPYKCTECDRAFVQAIALTQHLRVHTGEKPFACQTCDKSFRLKSACEAHQRIHTGERPYKCETCSKQFRHINHLKTHEKLHMGRPQFQCTECDKAFLYNHLLAAHMRLHTGEKPYVCAVCDEAFALAAQRQRHIKTTHQQIKVEKVQTSFTCDECGRLFRDRRLFANHLKIHSGDRPYKCEHCDKAFITQSDCKKHLRIHTGEKPYTCELCQKCFTFSNSYRIHMRNHFGEKPFKCPVCDKAFSCSSDRSKHVKTHQ